MAYTIEQYTNNKLKYYDIKYSLTDRQRIQLIKSFYYIFNFPNRNNREKNIKRFVEAGVDKSYVPRLNRLSKLSGGITLYSSIIRYGKIVGLERWNNYCIKQSQSNTYDYKSKKYGMSVDDFDRYNKSRSVTLDNMIRRYGSELGKDKFDLYRKKQSYAGSSLEYFIDKFGQENGEERWIRLNKSKSHSVESVLQRCGGDTTKAAQWFDDHKVCNFYSKKSQKLFDDIMLLIPPELHAYYATLNKEFGKINLESKRYYFYDFVIPELKLCIEYNGDHYHANPKMYKFGDIVNKIRGVSKTAVEIWESDYIKNKTLTDCGFNVIIVWDSDYLNNPNGVTLDMANKINELYNTLKL